MPTDASPSWANLLNKLVSRQDLSAHEATWAMNQVMEGEVSPVRLAGFLMGLRAKGETVEELSGLVKAMLQHALSIHVPGPTVDIVGTGGDRMNTVNISTMAAIVLAGTGLTVVKHGNRAASSASGSADVLEELGIRLDHPAQRVERIVHEAGITFCFAPTFHPSMRYAGAARKELGIPTAFNFLGPLTNPAQPQAAAVGCADLRMAPLMAGVFADRGASALVFRGHDGLDELAATGGPEAAASIWEVKDHTVTYSQINLHTQLGLTPISIDQLQGKDARYNAKIAWSVLQGERLTDPAGRATVEDIGPQRTQAIRETVLLNAAAAIVADGSLLSEATRQGDLAMRLRQGMDIAAQAVDSGSAIAALDRWRQASA